MATTSQISLPTETGEIQGFAADRPRHLGFVQRGLALPSELGTRRGLETAQECDWML